MELLDISDFTPQCETTSSYDGRTGLRILSIFIILIASALGVFFPILASKYSFITLPKICFFIAKFFGSGVIIATAFIHLLEPAADALGNECLMGTFREYPWAFGICLMSLFLLFLSELLTDYYVDKVSSGRCEYGHGGGVATGNTTNLGDSVGVCNNSANTDTDNNSNDKNNNKCIVRSMCHEDLEAGFGGKETLGGVVMVPKEVSAPSKQIDSENSNSRDETDLGADGSLFTAKDTIDTTGSISSCASQNGIEDGGKIEILATLTSQESACETCVENYKNQLLAVAILEFGILFHSVFIGLSLAVSGDEFPTLFVVLIFHQIFEGLGLGTRVAEVEWPRDKWYTPWLMGVAFSITVPISIAIGLGVKQTFIPGSRKALISSGVFDSISAGILIYTGLVELMAREFLFSEEFKGPNGLRKMLAAYFTMCVGAGLMALLGKWA